MSRVPRGLNAQYLPMFQTFFEQVKNQTLESKELATFTRLVLGGTAITGRNNATQRDYQKKQAGERTYNFKGVYGQAVFDACNTPGFLEVNRAMGASASDKIVKKVAKILKDAKNWEANWKKQCSTGWYSTLSPEDLSRYTAEERTKAEATIKLYSNESLIQKVVAFRQTWEPTFDTLAFAKKEIKIWNRQRREAKEAAKPPMVGGVQMPMEYHLVASNTIKEIEELLNDGILPQYEQWKVDQFARVSELLTTFNDENDGRVWTEEEMFTRQGYREVRNINNRYFTYGIIEPSVNWRSKDRTWTYKGLKPDWKALLEASIHETAEDMRLQFIGYMMEKLLPVVAMKDSTLVDATNYVDRAPRFGQYVRFNFAFEDSSSFDLEGCVEQSYSSRGLPFFRFPRRFYNATLPSGNKIKNGKMTPFKTMVEVFCQE